MGKDLKGKELGKCLYQRKGGIYCARYVDRFGRRVTIYDRKLSDLKIKFNELIYENETKTNIFNENITLDEWFKKWMEIYKQDVIRDTTKLFYQQLYVNHIKKVLGRFKLKDITNLQIQELLNNLNKNGYKSESQIKVLVLIKDMYDKAINNNFVKHNPAKGLRIVNDEVEERRVLSKDEQTIFFDCCKGTFYDNLFVVAITSGLRQGEICALTVDDIDFEKKEINVNKTLIYGKLETDIEKTFHLHPPKTKTSVRKVPISNQCEVYLKKQILQRNVIMSKLSAKPVKGFENLLFTTKFGTPINAQIFGDAIRKIVDEINLCRFDIEQFQLFSPHCFRHTFATRCFEAGIQAKTVQSYLGHSSVSMTLDLYTHVLDEYKQNEIGKLDNVFKTICVNGDSIAEEEYEKNKEKHVARIVRFAKASTM